MSSGERAYKLAMPNCRKPHRGNTAAPRTVRVAPELTRFYALRHRACDRAVNSDVMSLNILKDSLVSGRLAAEIVLRLKSVDRYHELQVWKRGPGQWDGAEGASHNLNVGTLDQLRQQDLEFAVPDKRVAPNNRQM